VFGELVATNGNMIPWCAMEVTVLVLFATTTLARGAGLHPVFDHRTETYSEDLKSCLSPDLAQHELSECRFFAITIDAGSTGTRLHLFELSHDVGKESSLFKVEREVFQEVGVCASCLLRLYQRFRLPTPMSASTLTNALTSPLIFFYSSIFASLFTSAVLYWQN
jgi:hypothetical protein